MHLIAGATGTLGGMVATMLLEQGERLRALVRSSPPGRPERLHTDPERLRTLGAELVDADLTKPETFGRALEGVTMVISAASASKRAPPDTMEAVDVEGTGAFARAAAAAGVRRFVYVSVAGADPKSPAPLLRLKGRAEEAVLAAGVPCTILRPAKYMHDWIGFVIGAQLHGGPRVQLVGDGEITNTFVDARDVARLAVTVLDRGDAEGEVIALAAEAATYRELVRRFERAVGTPITVEHLAVGAAVDTVDAPQSRVITARLTIQATSPPDDTTTPEVAARFGLRLTTIDEFLARSVA